MDSGAAVATYVERIPKLDLHAHLEGSVSPDGFDSPPGNSSPSLERDRIFQRVRERIRNRDDVVEILDSLGVRSARESVMYREITVTPHYHVRQGLALDPLLDALRTGRQRVESEHNVYLRYILNVHTSQDPSAGERMVHTLEPRASSVGVVGVGVYGPENPAAATHQRPALGRAARAGLGRTIHFDHHTSAKPIWDALYTLGLRRLDHPLAALEDPRLLRHLEKIAMPVLLCAASDLSPDRGGGSDTGPGAWEGHGITPVAVSDCPGFPGWDLGTGLERLARSCGWNADRVDRQIRVGLEAAFAGSDLKTILRERWREASRLLRGELDPGN